MARHPLDCLFTPRSIAVVGASDRPGSVGEVVFRNLREGGFKGELHAVNHRRTSVQGQPAVAALTAVGKVDLAVIAVPAASVPAIVGECGELGVGAAVVLSAGFAETGEDGRRLEARLLEVARRHRVRLLGPNCLGLVTPRVGLHAIFGAGNTRPGRVALVSQSGAVCTAILDWADARGLGFSSVVSLGSAADVGFGDVLDYLASDPNTDAIVLYVEGINHSRRFMSGLRAAARMRPVIAFKAGRHPASKRAVRSHTAALVGDDAVFESALRRAGAVRAWSLEQLFAAAETLARGARAHGDRLAIVTNAGGLGVMATDRAVDRGLSLARLAPSTVTQLDAVLPAHWSHGNPVDIIGDATPDRYAHAIETVLADEGVDGLLVLLTPQAMSAPLRVADAVIEAIPKTRKPLLSCFMGGGAIASAQARLTEGGAPSFPVPEAAVDAFADLAEFARNQRLLLQVPGPLSDPRAPDAEGARLIVRGALATSRSELALPEAKALLSAFRIPTTPSVRAHSADEALVAAETVGMPVALKIDSPAISHKSDVAGVRLGISKAGDVKSAYLELVGEVARRLPNAPIAGVTVEPMHGRRHGRELLVGVKRDAAFGPVISIGAGGTLVELIADQSVALPPLNRLLARDMIDRTRIRPLLDTFRNMPAVDLEAIENVLLRVSELVCELPEVEELDINPLVVDADGAIAVDARIALRPHAPSHDRYAHLAIHPYPSHLSREVQLADGTEVTVRPIRPEDAQIERAFVERLSPRARYFRFMQSLNELTPQMLVRFTQIDYDREMAFIAVVRREDRELEVGVSRYVEHPDRQQAEFALVVADDYQGKGIGSELMAALIDAARRKRLRRLDGEVLAENGPMRALVAHLGFSDEPHPDDPALRTVALDLTGEE